MISGVHVRRHRNPVLEKTTTQRTFLPQISHVKYSCPLVGQSEMCTEVDLACKEQPQITSSYPTDFWLKGTFSSA